MTPEELERYEQRKELANWIMAITGLPSRSPKLRVVATDRSDLELAYDQWHRLVVAEGAEAPEGEEGSKA